VRSAGIIKITRKGKTMKLTKDVDALLENGWMMRKDVAKAIGHKTHSGSLDKMLFKNKIIPLIFPSNGKRSLFKLYRKVDVDKFVAKQNQEKLKLNKSIRIIDNDLSKRIEKLEIRIANIEKSLFSS